MEKTIHTVLKQYYGYDHYKKGQEELINHILDGQDVLGILPTGAGKSICYQIPALMFSGVTIVISPLISLMKDQVDTLCEMGIKAAFINSTLSNQELIDVVRLAKEGEYKLIYVAPERLETDAFIDLIKSIQVSLIAVDEAHCVSQWGHDFRPSYTRINNIIKLLKDRPVVAAFTATATSIVKDDIIDILKLKKPFTLTTGFDRENLYFEVMKPKNKVEALINYIKKYSKESGIIYCSTRKSVESIYDYLQNQSYSVSKYHAGLSEDERTTNQDDFIYDRKQIMVATNAFGMGIDKSNIRYVIHYNMPKNMESYYQEAGRAGRDGEDANCLLLFGAQDIITNKFLIENNGEGNKDNEYQKLNEMVAYCNTDSCLRKYILNYFGQTDVSQQCDNCGNCNSEVESKDITLETQKILSCVKRMNEKFGTNQVVDVLVGANTEKIRSFNFNQLSTYGIMKEFSKDYIKEIISFLIAEGYLISSGNQYPILTLSSTAYDILKGNEKVSIKRVIENKQVKSANNVNSDLKLFEILRELRKDLAEKQHVPPFVIFSDASLHDMCKKYPTTNNDFLKITGVGENKLTKYGEVFINSIKKYVTENNIEIKAEEEEINKFSLPKKDKLQSKLATYDYYKNGHSIDEIAKLRGMSKMTIENHLFDCFREGLPFELPVHKDVELKIIDACKEVGTSLLKPIKELLPEEVTYTEIKYVIIKHNL